MSLPQPAQTTLALSVLALSFMLSPALAADTDHDHEHHGHEGGGVEVGISNSYIYEMEEGEGAYGVHIHSTYIFDESPFAIGVGYEAIFGDHTHQSLGLVACYRPIDSLPICLVPGVILPTEPDIDLEFVMHAEATYEFNVSGLHLGPTIGFAQTSDEAHLSLGLHTGVEF